MTRFRSATQSYDTSLPCLGHPCGRLINVTQNYRIPTMNTYTADCPPTHNVVSNGGDYLAEGMAGMQQSFVRALTRTA